MSIVIQIICILTGLILITIVIWVSLSFSSAKTQHVPVPDPNLQINVLKDGVVNAYALRSQQGVIMIDSGIGLNILKELQKLDIDPKDISAVFLTHSDYDHADGAIFLPNAQVYLSEAEKAMINGTTPRFGSSKFNQFKLEKYTTFSPDSEFKLHGIQIKTIPTPGHTVGHTAYLVNDNYLFTGDTARLSPRGNIWLFPRVINMNNQQEKKSNIKLKSLIQNHKIRFIGSGHSGFRIL
jgi:glyoxylase-like metal-dependent hydrolase (beta-lactamase superfamily II)